MAGLKQPITTLSDNRMITLALIVGLGIFLVLELAGLSLTDGVFVYLLDDPYIHLSMAEQIAAGGYGINPGEYASADSSILFPILLLPFAGTAFHAYLPLIYNALGLAIALILLAKIILESGLTDKIFVPFIILFAPVALNFQGIALLGMEHMLHIDTVLMALLGLMRWLKTGRLNALLIIAILVGPLLRYEALGLSLALSFALMFHGHKKAGIALALGALAPVVSFGFWLQSIGLSFLPNSVLAKSAFSGPDTNPLWAIISYNFSKYGNLPFALSFVAVGLGLLAVSVWTWKDRRTRVLALIAAAIALGHAVFGKFGWANRYEIYALVYVSTTIMVIAAPMLSHGYIWKLLVILALGLGAAKYGTFAVLSGINGPANIYSQQWQMARIARLWDGPVLANDIGLLSYGNSNKIIDLYGLASKEALEARRSRAPAGWPNRMAIEENAGLAMIYDNWFAKDLEEGWARVAYLDLQVPVPFIGPRVSIYATSPDMVAPVRALLGEFSSTLPRYAKLEMVGSQEHTKEEGR